MASKEKADIIVKQIVDKIEEIFRIIDLFDDSRPGNIGFTKLEEAIMWLNVMAHNVSLKNEVKVEKIIEDED